MNWPMNSGVFRIGTTNQEYTTFPQIHVRVPDFIDVPRTSRTN